MYGIVFTEDETDEKPIGVVGHPRILQQQDATDIPRAGKDRGGADLQEPGS